MLDQSLLEPNPLTGNTIYYTYDPVGNRIKKVVKNARGKVLKTVQYVYNPANQLVQVGDQKYLYDLCGNLTDDGEKEYIWNQAGRLVEVKNKEESESLATFCYDENG